MSKPLNGCKGCDRKEVENRCVGVALLDEIRPLRVDCWRPVGVVLVWDEREV